MGFGEAARPTQYELDAAELSSEGEEPCRSRLLIGAGELIMHPGVGSGPGGGEANRVGANPIADTWLDGINRRLVGTPEELFEDLEVPSLPASTLDFGRTERPTSWWRLTNSSSTFAS
jgi:hypothetical protein